MTETNEVLQAAARAVLSKKAEEPVLLDLRTISSFTDAFLLCHGNSRRQVQAIADAVEEALLGQFRRKPRTEGYPQGEWVLMDYGEVVVHVFTAEKREFFDLERLWGDAPRIELEDEGGDRVDSAPAGS
jgi:ribosome-associated protein